MTLLYECASKVVEVLSYCIAGISPELNTIDDKKKMKNNTIIWNYKLCWWDSSWSSYTICILKLWIFQLNYYIFKMLLGNSHRMMEVYIMPYIFINIFITEFDCFLVIVLFVISWWTIQIIGSFWFQDAIQFSKISHRMTEKIRYINKSCLLMK